MTHMHQMIYLPHGVDADHLEAVKAEMAERGAPAVRVVDCGDHFMAIEGCHRLMAAAELGIAPELIVLDQDEMVDADSLDIQDYFEAGQSYEAGEIAGELHGMCNPILHLRDDGTLEIVEA